MGKGCIEISKTLNLIVIQLMVWHIGFFILYGGPTPFNIRRWRSDSLSVVSSVGNNRFSQGVIFVSSFLLFI